MSKPENCISVQDAKDMQSNWMSTRAVDIAKAEGHQDTCAVTFNIADLQEYLDYVLQESKKQKIEEPGIRIYFAAYDNDDSDRSTVFLCPSMSDEGDSDNNYNIDPLNRGQGGWPPNAY
ncbi:hypothetical protein POV27_11440 [Aureisphaera galaxeae]|uniref:hypothetical protein n=1 Tax=Aureisphaera galaxeae TaxID=1538023 RepID=UPI0023505E76|nr:hypothetical protein [Aureisphaera galaxeae]MDC8004665.1 hypothetical protein [Aureisphaera galaxeae]